MKLLLVLTLLTFPLAAHALPGSDEDQNRGTAMDPEDHSVSPAHRETVIRGQLLLEDPLQVMPRLATVRLVKKGKVVAESGIDHGSFELRGNIAKGDYMLEATAKCFQGSRSLSISDPDVSDVQLSLRKGACR